MRKGSNRPCPGCGRIVEYRKSDKVCQDCESKLKRVEFLEQQLSKLSQEEIVVAVGQCAHWNAYLYAHSAGYGRKLMDVFQRVADAGSRASMTRNAEYSLLGKIDSFGEKYIVMPRALADAVRELRTEVQNAMKAEYEKGKTDGHSVLMRLANGDLSMNDFDESLSKSD